MDELEVPLLFKEGQGVVPNKHKRTAEAALLKT